MHKHVICLIGTASLLVLEAAVGADLGHAQQARLPSSAPDGVPFGISVVDDLSYGEADAVIVRRTNAEIQDVILVRKGKAQPLVLAAAVRQLASLRAAFGDAPTADGTYRVQLDSRPWIRPRESAGWVGDLATARPRELEGVGVVKHIILYMPRQQR